MGSAVTLASCTGTIAETPRSDAGLGTHHDSGLETTDAGWTPSPDADSPIDASIEAGSVACPTRSGYFQCGSNVCDRSIQACESGSCIWYGELASYWSPQVDAQACGACPTCACVPSYFPCSEDDAGTLVISSAQTCYGAPPARLTLASRSPRPGTRAARRRRGARGSSRSRTPRATS
jgi:hypothetical protein